MGGTRESTRRSAKRPSGAAEVPGVHVLLQRAEGLPSADSNGLSDPYAVFKIGKLAKHKSATVRKTLDPEWQESFFLPAPPNTSVPMTVTVKDYDFMSKDDYLGEVTLDISHLPEDGSESKFALELTNAKSNEPAGTIYFTLKRSLTTLGEVESNRKAVKRWAVSSGDRKVVVEAIRGMELVSMDSNGLSDPYLSIRLGKIKHKSKVVAKDLNPVWKQRFEFPLKQGDSPLLTVKVWDKDMLSRDDFMGQVQINVDTLQPTVVNEEWYDVELEGGIAGHLHLLITVLDTSGDLVMTKEQRASMVGSLKCHVVQAKGLRSADLNGKSDPYCELQVGNARLRTQTIGRTLDPLWDRMLELPVRDIFSCLEIAVWDEDRGGKSRPDFLGKIVVPLLEIENNKTSWFVLKSRDGTRKVKGELQVAFNLTYKVPKAYMTLVERRDFNFMEYEEPFSVRKLVNSIKRLSAINMVAIEGVVQGWKLLQWDMHPAQSVAAIFGWIALCLLFRIWMIPFVMLVVILVSRIFNYQSVDIIVDSKGNIVTRYADGATEVAALKGLGLEDDDEEALEEALDDESSSENDEPEEEDGIEGSAPRSRGKKKKRKKTRRGLMTQLRILRRIAYRLQEYAVFLASIGERFKNIVNWSVPLITGLVCVGLAFSTVLFFFVPWNVVLMVVGVYQFVKRGARRYLWPRSKFHVPIIEVVEFLGRVPTDMDLVQRARVPPTDLSTQKSAKLIEALRRSRKRSK